MSNADFELLIDDPSDLPAGAKPVETPVDTPKAPAAPTVPDGVAELRRQLAEAQQRAVRSEQVTQQALQKAQAAEAYAGSTQYQAITNALAQNNDRMEMLKAQLKEASNLGETDRVADLTVAIADARYNIRELERGKEYIEQQAKQPPRQEQPKADVTVGADDVSPAAREWAKKHPEVLTDRAANNRMLAGHYSAVASGLAEDTPEYFAHIDGFLEPGGGAPKGRVADAPPAREEKREEAPERPMARYAAPVDRDTGPRKVQLRITQDMKDAAAISGMTIEEYAAQYVKTHGVK
jgi:hypothetical protein